MQQIDIKAKDTQACEAGDQFVKTYYENFDKRRHVISKLYTETATLSWNGNQVNGQDAITKFYDGLPGSRHNVSNVDAQPLTSEIAQGQTAIVVVTAGTVKYEGSKEQMFSQTLTLTAQDNKWKVVADCVRVVG